MWTYEVVGSIRFDGIAIDVYDDVNEPLFALTDVAKLIGYRVDHAARLTDLCESDEYSFAMAWRGKRKVKTAFVTEMGLYNILSQMRLDTARKWRRIIHEEIIAMRKERSWDIIRQFDEWDHRLNDLYIDEETGILMESVTIPGGDVEQRPYKCD